MLFVVRNSFVLVFPQYLKGLPRRKLLSVTPAPCLLVDASARRDIVVAPLAILVEGFATSLMNALLKADFPLFLDECRATTKMCVLKLAVFE